MEQTARKAELTGLCLCVRFCKTAKKVHISHLERFIFSTLVKSIIEDEMEFITKKIMLLFQR